MFAMTSYLISYSDSHSTPIDSAQKLGRLVLCFPVDSGEQPLTFNPPGRMGFASTWSFDSPTLDRSNDSCKGRGFKV